MNKEFSTQFYNQLQDEESKKIFELRKMIDWEKNYIGFLNGLIDLNKKYVLSPYDDCYERCKGKKVAVFGAGIDGKMTWYLLKQRGIKVDFFVDNDEKKWGTQYCGAQVISTAELKFRGRDFFVILASRKYAFLFYNDLITSYFPRENIWYPRIGTMFATTGNQYFDCPEMKHEEDEFFIDCGCLDGETDRQFISWCGGAYKKIIAFEPDIYSYQNIKKTCNDIENFEIYNAATGKTAGQGSFNMCVDGGSRLSDEGTCIVAVESIDHVLQGEKATFIKMDVEGAELESLMGAHETIKNYKPKLAISIYHKPEDIINIPEYIMKCRDDYKFYIRHYTSCTYETILYAI